MSWGEKKNKKEIYKKNPKNPPKKTNKKQPNQKEPPKKAKGIWTHTNSAFTKTRLGLSLAARQR